MTELRPTTADDPARLLTDLRRALDDGPALGLGLLGTPPATVEPGTAVVIGTSGSSGIPKHVVISAEALRASAEATAERLGHGRWVLALPGGYVAGLQVLVRSVLAGTDPAIVEGKFTARAFADATLRALGDEPLFTSLVPAQLATVLDACADPGIHAAAQSYRAILVGGQALPAALRDRASELGVTVVRTYGSTETSGGCVYDGMPLDTVLVHSVDGELHIAGPMLADGYLGDAKLTRETFWRDDRGIRWYRTGDLGIVDDGVVRVHGRADNVIVSGGINISLDRVERLVRQVPGLSDAVVVGVPDERWGEASVIVATPGDELRRSKADQLEHARTLVGDDISAPARPARLILVDEIPVLASGKPDRETIARIASELH